jgi:hypothetical protein
MTKQLTANQTEALYVLSQYAGQTVQVLTSQYDANVAAKAKADSVGTFSSAAIRGLASKGFIRIEGAYWKGATLTVLASQKDCMATVEANWQAS